MRTLRYASLVYLLGEIPRGPPFRRRLFPVSGGHHADVIEVQSAKQVPDVPPWCVDKHHRRCIRSIVKRSMNQSKDDGSGGGGGGASCCGCSAAAAAIGLVNYRASSLSPSLRPSVCSCACPSVRPSSSVCLSVRRRRVV